MRRSRAPGPRDYPYFELQVWGGRLQTPPQYRGTPIQKQFESGRLGGRKIIREERFADTSEGREDLLQTLGTYDDTEVFYLRSHRHSRQRIGTSQLYRPHFVKDGLTD